MPFASAADVDAVRERIGREPAADFAVVVRDPSGAPVVVKNEPFTRDGTPMPTRFWFVDPDLVLRVARLEAAGGVRAAGAAVDAAELAAAHARYAAERDAAVPAAHAGPRPSGGSVEPGAASSACTRTTPGTSQGATTRSAAGCSSELDAADAT